MKLLSVRLLSTQTSEGTDPEKIHKKLIESQIKFIGNKIREYNRYKNVDFGELTRVDYWFLSTVQISGSILSDKSKYRAYIQHRPLFWEGSGSYLKLPHLYTKSEGFLKSNTSYISKGNPRLHPLTAFFDEASRAYYLYCCNFETLNSKLHTSFYQI